MQVLSAAGMHNSLYMDELMTAAVNTAKYQLQYNVLALHDPQYKRLYRPSSAAADSGAPLPSTGGKRKARETAAARCVAFVKKGRGGVPAVDAGRTAAL